MNIDRQEPDFFILHLNDGGTYAVKVILCDNPTYAQALLVTPDNPEWHAARDNAIVALLAQQLYSANNRIEELEDLYTEELLSNPDY